MFPDGWIAQDRSLYLTEQNILIISDIHFGQYKHSRRTYKNIQKRIEQLIDNFNPETLILNGDTWTGYPFDDKSLYILDMISKKVGEIILIEGNHEEKCGGFSEQIKNSFKIMKQYKIDDILIHHGHHTPSETANHHIVGHIHPRFKDKIVYLHSDNAYFGASVTILPAFHSKIQGHDIRDFNFSGHCPILNDGKNILDYKSQPA